MLLRILKKDLVKRKGVNIILFLFITLASVFLSSSVNNILSVTSAVDYFMEYSCVPDVNIVMNGETERKQIEDWLREHDSLIEEYDYDTLLVLSAKDTDVKSNGKTKPLDADGDDLYMGLGDMKYNKVFDENGEQFSLRDGEMAVSKNFCETNNLKRNDKIIVNANGTAKEFTIKVIMKDAAFGSQMASMMRMIVCEDNYNLFKDKSDKLGLYYVNSPNVEKFTKEFAKQDFTTVVNQVTRDVYEMIYSFEMIIAALLILVGICLILIALLVLRFTLVFTIEEDYPEIGIMKAVGFRGFSIKRIYLIKYLAIVSAGSIIGLFFSVPISTAMVKGVSINMIMEDGSANFWSNIICTIIIIFLVMLFCYQCTRKLNKVSAISAIRGGNTGERYGARMGLCFYKRKKMSAPVFLGINDTVSHLKRYLVLVITFCLSFILITIPLNTLNTMNSDEMAEKFLLNKDSAVYLKRIEGKGESNFKSSSELEKRMDKVETELKEKGYDATLVALPLFFFKYSAKGEKEKYNIMTAQTLGGDSSYVKYEEGSAPKLADEIAFSQGILEKNNWKIGDLVETTLGGERQTFMITGSYTDYMQLGQSARLNPAINCEKEQLFSYWCIMVNMDTDKTQEELVSTLSKELPDYEWTTAQAIVNKNVGGVQDILADLLIPMTAMLCAVIMLITVLMEKLFIVREKGEIAMMKSMGFRNWTIRSWQIIRMIGVVAVSMIFAVPLSFLSNQWILKPIFAIMGADVNIQVVPWLVYGVYPGVLLAGIIVATVFATRTIIKIDIRELNNLE